jgi:glucan 1,3-beta-glucosidase
MIQTESPYFQYAVATESPGPFNITSQLDGNYFSNEPTFPDDTSTCIGNDLSCNFSWAVMVSEVTNLTIAGAGLYSWFDAYDQSVCVDAQNCQQRLISDQGYNIGFYLWNLVTIGSVEMVSDTSNNNTNTVFAANNTQLDSHPFWSALAAYGDDAGAEVIGCTDDDTSAACSISTYCDYTLIFNTLDDISAASAAGSISDVCISWYTLQTLSTTLDGSMTNYTAVDKGYDQLFKYYVEYVKNMVPDAISKFMAGSSPNSPNGGAGQQYFDCTYVGKTTFSQPCPISVSNAPEGHLAVGLKIYHFFRSYANTFESVVQRVRR